MANRSSHTNPMLAPGRNEFHLNFRFQWQICDREQAHPHLTQIDAKSIHMRGSHQHLYRGIQQLPFASTPVLPGVAFENHFYP